MASPPPRPAPPAPTADQILDIAERLAQTRGFNGFSYADISEEIGLTTATLHYHFRTKAELGRRLIARYAENFGNALDRITARHGRPHEQLSDYVQLYAEVLRDHRMCLCGMLAAEYTTLPNPMREEIRSFFDANEAWLGVVAEAGRSDGSLSFEGSARDAARLLVAALEGAMLVARSFDDVSRFHVASDRLLDDLRSTP